MFFSPSDGPPAVLSRGSGQWRQAGVSSFILEWQPFLWDISPWNSERENTRKEDHSAQKGFTKMQYHDTTVKMWLS